MRMAADEEPKVREQAVRALGTLAREGEQGRPALLDALKDRETAVRVAAAQYARAGDAARGADNALAVTISEEGSAVTGASLRRLAAAAGVAAEGRAAVQAFMHPGS